MQLIGMIIIGAGWYLLSSAVKNRDPVAFVLQLIADPTNIRGKLEASEGTWITSGSGLKASPVDSDVKGIHKLPANGLSAPKQEGVSGMLKDNELQSISFASGQRLIPSAANALELMNRAFKAQFGRNIGITDSYRSYAAQVTLKAKKPVLAGKPGTSNHGWGRALDLSGPEGKFGTTERNWLVANGGKFGWVSPPWAQQNGSKPEAWHWEFTGA